MKNRISSLLLFLLAIVVSLPSEAEFELADGKFKIGAMARFRYEYFNDRDFVAANDTFDFVYTRFMTDFTFLPHEKVKLFFQPQFSGGWGEVFATSITSINSTNAGTTSGAINDPALGIHQAYMSYMPTDYLTVTLGRQEWNYGEQLLIGSVAWHNVGRSFDGAKLHFTNGDKYYVDVLYSYLSDAEAGNGRNVATGSQGDHHFGGIYASVNVAEWLKEWDFYALYRLDSTARPRAHNYVTFGTRLKGKSNSWDYRLEATGQYGKSTISGGNNDQRDYQADAEVGYTFDTDNKFRIGVEALIASENYIQMFPTAHKFLGYIDLFGRRNIMAGVLHLSMKPADKWSVKLDAHTILRNDTNNSMFRLNGTTAIGGTGVSNSRLAGEEIDFAVRYQALDILSFQAGMNVFIPMGFIKSEIGDDMPMFGYLQSRLKF